MYSNHWDMSCKQETYKRLGDYIREVDVRNRDLQCTNLLGLSIAKVFIPSIANTVGTDLRYYKIVKHNQFAFVPVTSRNGDKITIALYDGQDDCIISQAYISFEVKNVIELLPEYLMMWFRRPEFDRYARFKSHGSAREVFDWEEMCNVMMPVPDPTEQQRIVDQYNAIQKRIDNNKQTIAKLEDAAQAIYRKMFVEDIDPENLPEGWRCDSISTIIESTIGGGWGKEVSNGNYVEKVTCIRGADINAMKVCDMSNAPVRYILNKNLESRKLNANDIVIEMSGGTPTQSTGRCSIALPIIIQTCNTPMICSNFCKLVRAKKGKAILLFTALEHFYSLGYFFKYENSSIGIQNLDFDSFCREETILIADEKTISDFNNLIMNLFEHKLTLGKEVIILRKTLDQILINL